MAPAVSRRPVIANGRVQSMVSPCEICGKQRGILPVSVTARSTAHVCGHSVPAGVVGSNPTGGTDVCPLRVLYVVRQRSLRRADHSSRGVLPTVVRRCV